LGLKPKISPEYVVVSYIFFSNRNTTIVCYDHGLSVVAFVAWDKGEKLKGWEKWVEEFFKNLG
jgi:hypothetical protein